MVGPRDTSQRSTVACALAPWVVELKTPCVFYDEDFMPSDEANEIYADLRKSLRWETNSSINRMTVLHGEISGAESADDSQYHYKDAPSLKLQPWTATLLSVKKRVEHWYTEKTGIAVSFNVCLGNYYIDGQNRIGWHTDREEIGRSTPIASVSLGAPRRFLLRGMTNREDSAAITLGNGSLTIMENECQHRYVHCIPREQDVSEGRINLTFRCKTEVTTGEQQHARSRENAINRSKSFNASRVYEPGHNAETTADSAPNINNAAEVVIPAFVAALVAAKWSGMRHSSHTTLSTVVATSMAAVPVAIGAASGLGCLWNRCLSNPARILWRKAGDVSQLRRKDTDVKPAFIVLCQMGIEDIVEEEIFTRLKQSGLDWHTSRSLILKQRMRGLVMVASGGDETEAALLGLRTANYVLAYHCCFALPATTPRADGVSESGAVRIYSKMTKMLQEGALTVPRLAAGAGSFRTSCDRSGKHDFSSQEVEYEAGGALQEFYGTKCKMKQPEVTVRVCVIGEMIVLGTQLHEDDLAKRRNYKFVNRVTLKSNLAACMLGKANLLQPRSGARLLDMFCGSGTVLLEWVDIIRHTSRAAKDAHLAIEAVGIDVSLGAVQGARANAEAEGAGANCNFIKCDAKAMRAQLTDGTFDAIVTNVPWGVQTGNDAKVDLEKLYEMVLRNSWHLLRPKGRVVLLVLRGLQVLQILRRLSFRFKILEMRVVKTANNLPTMFVLERVESDPQYDHLKAELYELGDYVSMSTSTFMAVHSSGKGAGDHLSGFKRK